MTNTKGVTVSSIPELLGVTLTNIVVKRNSVDDSITFTRADGADVWMGHIQDCCESVDITDINGDVEDLLGSPLLVAEVRTLELPVDYGDAQATFYELRTARGGVTIRWNGTSNGYYSTSVTILERKS